MCSQVISEKVNFWVKSGRSPISVYENASTIIDRVDEVSQALLRCAAGINTRCEANSSTAGDKGLHRTLDVFSSRALYKGRCSAKLSPGWLGKAFEKKVAEAKSVLWLRDKLCAHGTCFLRIEISKEKLHMTSG